jgi:hypothetical protein
MDFSCALSETGPCAVVLHCCREVADTATSFGGLVAPLCPAFVPRLLQEP